MLHIKNGKQSHNLKIMLRQIELHKNLLYKSQARLIIKITITNGYSEGKKLLDYLIAVNSANEE